MKRNFKFAGALAVALMVFALVAPHAAFASSRGIFKDVYCALLSVVGKECTTEVAGIKVQI